MTVRFLAVCALMATMSGVANAQNVREPGGIPEDQVLALTTPDEFAWQLFFFMNRPAKPGPAGVADETARFGDTAGGRPMVWETWALASGDDQSEIYKPDGSKPVEWTQLDRSTRRLILSPNREKQAVTADSRIAAPPGASAFFPVSPDDQEVRSNRATFDFIRDNVLYNRDGLEDQLAKARSAGDRLGWREGNQGAVARNHVRPENPIFVARHHREWCDKNLWPSLASRHYQGFAELVLGGFRSCRL